MDFQRGFVSGIENPDTQQITNLCYNVEQDANPAQTRARFYNPHSSTNKFFVSGIENPDTQQITNLCYRVYVNLCNKTRQECPGYYLSCRTIALIRKDWSFAMVLRMASEAGVFMVFRLRAAIYRYFSVL